MKRAVVLTPRTATALRQRLAEAPDRLPGGGRGDGAKQICYVRIAEGAEIDAQGFYDCEILIAKPVGFVVAEAAAKVRHPEVPGGEPGADQWLEPEHIYPAIRTGDLDGVPRFVALCPRSDRIRRFLVMPESDWTGTGTNTKVALGDLSGSGIHYGVPVSGAFPHPAQFEQYVSAFWSNDGVWRIIGNSFASVLFGRGDRPDWFYAVEINTAGAMSDSSPVNFLAVVSYSKNAQSEWVRTVLGGFGSSVVMPTVGQNDPNNFSNGVNSVMDGIPTSIKVSGGVVTWLEGPLENLDGGVWP